MKETDLNFIEIDNYKLENSEFYKLYNGLGLNGGVIFKRVSTIPQNPLIHKINTLGVNESKEHHSSFTANAKTHDFIYEFLTNEGIVAMGWRYDDDEVFTFLSKEYNSIEKFRHFMLEEVTSEKLKKELLDLVLRGSVYSQVDKSEWRIKLITNRFYNLLHSIGPIKKILIAYWPWGNDNHLSLFRCIFILFENEILLFAKDDYD